MKCLFVYNPNSGNGRINKYLSYVVNRLSKRFDQIDCHPTKNPQDATKIAREACGVYDYLIFAGGDGTFNEVIQGISVKINGQSWAIYQLGLLMISPRH